MQSIDSTNLTVFIYSELFEKKKIFVAFSVTPDDNLPN